MDELISYLEKTGLIPVVTINDPAKAPYLAEALQNGGINCAEITFRTDAAYEAIKHITRTGSDFFAAAGTVLTTEQADKAADAGAKLMVAPGFNRYVFTYSRDTLGVPFIPGVATPSEIDLVYSLDQKIVKFFPAEAMGGIKYIKAVSAPYNMMKFMPTGGISPENLGDYLKLKQVVCCGGSWIAPKDLIEAKDFGEITKRAAEAVRIVKEVRG